jgi:hypothetical protein
VLQLLLVLLSLPSVLPRANLLLLERYPMILPVLLPKLLLV